MLEKERAGRKQTCSLIAIGKGVIADHPLTIRGR
jgi:hypothetical protein